MRHRLRTLMILGLGSANICGGLAVALTALGNGRADAGTAIVVAGAVALGALILRCVQPLMFRFTIRDVLWLTALVAVGLGWGARESQLRRELADAKLWRGRAGALEHALVTQGRRVKWNFKDSCVWVYTGDPSTGWAGVSTIYCQPSENTDADWP